MPRFPTPCGREAQAEPLSRNVFTLLTNYTFHRGPTVAKNWNQKHKRTAPDAREAFLKAWSPFGQDLANLTGEPTILVRDQRGVARLTVQGWPLAGEHMADFMPTAGAHR